MIDQNPPFILNESDVSELPAGPGVYRITPERGETHISWSGNLRRRVNRLSGLLQGSIRRMECWPTASKLDSSILLYSLTRSDFPDDYARRLRLRPPWFVSLSEDDPFPQPLVSHRIYENGLVVLGPFRSRDSAQAYVESVLGLFQVRRCPGTLLPSPGHPGCVYGEIGQCLRPCQCVVSREEYLSEVERLHGFLANNGRTMMSTLLLQRNRASEELDFEAAAQAHKRLEKAKLAASIRDSAVVDARRFCGVALTRAAQSNACQLRLMWNGFWQVPLTFAFDPLAGFSASMDSQVRGQLANVAEKPVAEGQRADHLALFGRWFRSSWCDGEWFPFENLDKLDYRKLVRRMSKSVQSHNLPTDA